MNKVIFLDRDGTINIDYGYVYKKEDFYFINGVFEALKEMNELGYLLVVISNQSGIARGYYSKEDCDNIFDYMVDTLNKEGIIISKYYYCPHDDSDDCNCRKPKLEMFMRAIDELDVDVDRSFAIGDKIRDLSICNEYPIRGILLTNDNVEYNNIVNKKNMQEALEYIKDIDGV